MRKILITLFLLLSFVGATATPGVIHFIFDNAEVTQSGDDTYYEFDIQAYISNTEKEEDLILGYGILYVEYDNNIFGDMIAGTQNLVIEKAGILAGDIVPDMLTKFIIHNSNNTFNDVFSISFEPAVTSSPGYYEPLSTDENNPSGLFHIKIKAIASGSGEVLFPYTRINDVHDQFRTYANVQYDGPMDFSLSNEEVYIQGPVSGEPYTSIELKSLEAAYKGGMVRLKWKTASETENMGFIIKRAAYSGEMIGIYEELDTYLENDALLGAGTTSNNTTYMWFDKSVRPGSQYAYVLQDVDYEGHIRESEPIIVTIPENTILTTDKFEFAAGYPNPFNPYFVVPFEIFEATAVDIRVYDMQGRLVKVLADREFAPGTYNLLMDGSGLSSGMYLLRTQVENFVETQKMMLVK